MAGEADETEKIIFFDGVNIFRDKYFYRGFLIGTGLLTAEFALQSLLRPPQVLSYALTYGIELTILVTGLILLKSRRALGLGLLFSFLFFVIAPIVYIFVIVLTNGRLM